MQKKIRFLYTFSLFLTFFFGFSQELPPIVRYSPSTYGAGNQNWMMSQDDNHFLFFANNEGLLEFNGSNWTLYPSPNETIIRSVKVIENKIYTGCYMEFGFWNRQTNGQLKYTSLSKTIKNKIQDDEQFWNIVNYDQWVIFQSLDRIYIYDTKTGKFNIIAPKNGVLKSFRANNSIYFHTINEGLFEIENGKSKLVSNDPILKFSKIVNVFSSDEGLLIQTQLSGFYKLINGSLSKFATEAESELAASSIYSSEFLSDGSYALGTVSNGVFILTKDGKIKYHLTQNRGLSNNTALSLFEDADKNLWIGLDNGINCINLQSPVKSFSDDTGSFGTVYTSLLHNGILYIGTNQGLFYKGYETSQEFKFIPGTKGQVWSLFEYENTIFCGHDSGTFLVENGSARNIFMQSGTWKFETIPNHPELLLQGNYYGLSILQKIDGQWIFRNKISGFDYSSKYFEINNAREIYVSHEYKGVFRLQLDALFQKMTTHFITYTSPKKGKNASLAKFNNVIYYACKDGIFKLDEATKQFKKDQFLSAVFENDEYTSGKLIIDNSNKLWLFSKSYIHYFSLSKLSSELKQNAIPIPASLTNSMLGYENITQLTNAIYLIGTTDGYYTININDLSFKNYSVSISKISSNKLNEKFSNRPISEEGEFHYDENNITFTYTVPEYNKYISAEYQYLLEGNQEQWSEWSAKPTINFKNLPPGDYTFKVRAKIANSAPENTVAYHFKILKPWYATNFAILIYLILLLVAAHFINKAYKNYYQKQREKLIEENNLLLEIKELENEQQLMKLRNEQLAQDFDAKNRELAVSTMSLIKKNELLALIKEDLKKNSDDSSKNIRSVITTINRNISEEDTWNVFKEAFDNADKDFLKKVKFAHPSLTPNDLRLCAYLRLNLSSKEIAPLLNISVRSVEIKRYRLRKKMDLSHEQGLVEYILSI
ncbi:helix-turn-helix and ligand-binding sensor domain-containing protein [Flavobacterium noncentrifugens]|uniref:Two component regulator propeller n=1 Tax=Flavobacterium noncentrifugens TaxID=1128970 RepID=A0A1G8YK19_9FLAO|nr:triple tyrosine motif-containing protein [Flavobacterium noncentrifugens]SDK02430.1 Two component regulator propeller [Flavobacterium noncentrifugens]